MQVRKTDTIRRILLLAALVLPTAPAQAPY